MPKSLAIALAARLKAITHHDPALSETAHLIRVTAHLPERLTDRGRLSLLVALADADRFGHVLTDEGGAVWAEVDTEKSRPDRSS